MRYKADVAKYASEDEKPGNEVVIPMADTKVKDGNDEVGENETKKSYLMTLQTLLIIQISFGIPSITEAIRTAVSE